MLFGERVRELANEKGVSQAELARRSGMSISRVNMVWRDKVADPRLETLILFARALNIEVGELIDGVQVPRGKKAANAEKV